MQPSPKPRANPTVILYPPSVAALNTVHISGSILNDDARVQSVSVLAEPYGSRRVIAQGQVPIAQDGRFSANLLIPAGSGVERLVFVATAPGAQSAGIARYFNPQPMRRQTLALMTATRQTIGQMGADFPIYLPAWLPQTLSVSKPSLGAYSTALAAKSFNYQVQIFQTAKPFAVNSPSMRQNPNRELATVGGTRFANAAQASQHLTLQSREALPSASAATRAVPLAGRLSAFVFADRWHSVVWHEGKWLLVVRGPDSSQNLQEARITANILQRVSLPPAPGVVWIRNIAGGNGPAVPNVTVSFVQGRDLYDVWTEGSLYDPLVLAAAMKS